MDTSSNLPEDDNSSKWAPSPRVVNSNPLTYEDILAGPNMHETQPSIEPAFGANPIYPHTSISSHTDPNLAWHPVVPTQFHDGGLEEDVVAASRGIFDSAPVPYTSAEFPGVQSQMSLSRFNALFPPPRDPDHTPTGCSVTDSNVVVGEAGRTYHGYKEGAYDLPNDAQEQDRLDLQHTMFTLVLDGRLALAPMQSSPRHVIDVATGTGIWANQFAQQNPSSFVIGTDLSLIQPGSETTGILNCEFIRDDAEEEWIFPHTTFDYVHIRAVALSFQNPRMVLRNALNNMSPGGWIEYQDLDLTPRSHDGSHEGTGCQRLLGLIQKAIERRGRCPNVAAYYKGWLEEEGLVDIKELTFEIPANGWPDDPKLKRIGEYMLVDFYENCYGASFKLLRSLGMSTEEIEDVVSHFKRDAPDRRNHIFYRFHVVYGRKPSNEETDTSNLGHRI